MRAGSLEERISIERNTPSKNDYNEDVSNWSEIGKRWAKVYYGNGSERRQSAEKRELQSATFQVRLDSLTETITVTDRIVFDGSVWDIGNIAKRKPHRGAIEITAAREQ